MNTINKFADWLWYSSANPENVAMSVKGVMLAAVPLVIHFTQLDQHSVFQVVEQITATVSQALILVGLLRKLFITINGWFLKQQP